jgi:hypothetical protein
LNALPSALPSALADAWAQAPGETDAQYEAFLVWLDAGESRTVPAPEWQGAATRFGWSERVLAYERAQALAARPAETPQAQIEANLLHLATIESGKLLRSSATTIGPIMSVAELVKVLGYLAELRPKGDDHRRPVTDTPDLQSLSLHDLETLYAAQAIVQRAKGT